MRLALVAPIALVLLVGCDSRAKREITKGIKSNNVSEVVRVVEERILKAEKDDFDEDASNTLNTAINFVGSSKNIQLFNPIIDRFMDKSEVYNKKAVDIFIAGLVKNGWHDYKFSMHVSERWEYSSLVDTLRPLISTTPFSDLQPDMEVISKPLFEKANAKTDFKEEINALHRLSNFASSTGNGGPAYQVFDNILISVAKRLPPEDVYGVTSSNYNDYSGFFQKTGFNQGRSKDILSVFDEIKAVCEKIKTCRKDIDNANEYITDMTVKGGQYDAIVSWAYGERMLMVDNAATRIRDKRTELVKLHEDISNQESKILELKNKISEMLK